MSKEFHIALDKNQGAKYALLPGDPGRVKQIAKFLDKQEKLAENREFVTYCGYLKGERILVTSTGIGGPSAAIALEELSHIGVDTFIRIGTCGAMQPDILPGTVIIPTAAARFEGTSREYMPIEFPAAADFDIVSSLKKASDMMGAKIRVGVVHTKDSFYGQHQPKSMPVSDILLSRWHSCIEGGALGSEMECAALFTVAAARGLRGGAVLHALWNQERKRLGIDDADDFNLDITIQIAIRAIELLIKEK